MGTQSGGGAMNSYDQILSELAAGELPVIERKVFDALKAHPEGLLRPQLVAIVFEETVKAGGPSNNNTKDRKVRRAIESLRERMVPIVSSSGRAGYRLDTSMDGRRRMLADLIKRRDSLSDLISRAAKFYSTPDHFPEPQIYQQSNLV